MQGGGARRPEDRVHDALAHLGADSTSAPAVPATVTARLGPAWRPPPPPAHAVTSALPRLSGLRLALVIVGICAAAATVAVGVALLMHTAPAPRFPTGPTAERITVSVPTSPGDTPKTVVTRP